MFVYVIVNHATLKVYVGQHKGTNLQKYLQDKICHALRHEAPGSHLYQSMRKHPRIAWSIHPLLSDIQTRDEVDSWEQFYIKALKSQHPAVGYNICRGGEGRTGPQSEAAKKKIALANINRPCSLETRAKIGAANAITALGQKQSDETKAKHAASTKRLLAAGILPSGRPVGFHHSEATLVKMRESAKGRNMDKAIRASADARRGKTHPNRTTPEGIEKMKVSKFLKTVAWG